MANCYLKMAEDHSSKLYKNLMWICYVVFIAFSEFISYATNSKGTSSHLGGYILMAIIATILVIHMIHTKWSLDFPVSVFSISLFCFPVFCLLSSIWAYSRSRAFNMGLNQIEISCTYLLFLMTVEDEKEDIDRLLKALMVANYITVFYSIMSYGIGTFLELLESSERLESSYINANTLGMSCAYAIVLNIYFLIKKKCISLTPFMIIAITVLVISQSRKALIIVVLGVLMIAILTNIDYKRPLNSILKIVIALLFAFIILFLLSKSKYLEGSMERINNMLLAIRGAKANESSVTIRMEMKQIGWEIFSEHPILGLGADNAGLICGPHYGWTYYYLHDNYIELLADTGIIGLLLYYFIYFFVLLRMICYGSFDDKELDICVILLIIRLIMDYGCVSYEGKHNNFYLLVFWLESEKIRKQFIEHHPILSSNHSKYLDN